MEAAHRRSSLECAHDRRESPKQHNASVSLQSPCITSGPGIGASEPANIEGPPRYSASEYVWRTDDRDNGETQPVAYQHQVRNRRGRILNENLLTHDAHALFQQAVAIDRFFALGEYSLASTSPTARELAEPLQKALTLADNASRSFRTIPIRAIRTPNC